MFVFAAVCLCVPLCICASLCSCLHMSPGKSKDVVGFFMFDLVVICSVNKMWG